MKQRHLLVAVVAACIVAGLVVAGVDVQARRAPVPGAEHVGATYRIHVLIEDADSGEIIAEPAILSRAGARAEVEATTTRGVSYSIAAVVGASTTAAEAARRERVESAKVRGSE